VCFILAKTYAGLYELDKALEFCLESCKLNKQFINNFALLSLIYSARGELKKSELLINELYKENPYSSIICIFKAYLETEKILWA
jgi:hypothetical protein